MTSRRPIRLSSALPQLVSSIQETTGTCLVVYLNVDRVILTKVQPWGSETILHCRLTVFSRGRGGNGVSMTLPLAQDNLAPAPELIAVIDVSPEQSEWHPWLDG